MKPPLPAAIAVLLLVGSGSALASQRGSSGLYVPPPGSAPEAWVLRQVAHRIRLERGVIFLLRKLKSDPETAAEFAEITEEEMLQEARNHDNSKVSFSRRYLLSHHLPLDDFIPEHIAHLIEAGVRPAPEGTEPADPLHPTPEEEFRIWVDRLNHADELDEENLRRGLPRPRRQKRALIMLAADLLDTGLMRDEYLQATRRMPTVYVRDQIAQGWPRFLQLGPELERLIPLVQWAEEVVRPGMTRWEDRMEDLRPSILVPYLRRSCASAMKGLIPAR